MLKRKQKPSFFYRLSTVLIAVLFLTAGVFTIPQIFGYRVFAVVSESMEPEFPVGSILFTKAVPPSSVAIGDCITFLADTDAAAGFVTHRVMQNDAVRGVFITKGDANRLEDAPVSYGRLVGRGEDFAIPLIGYIAIWLRGGNSLLRGIALCAGLLPAILRRFWGTGNEERLPPIAGHRHPEGRGAGNFPIGLFEKNP